MEAAEPSTGVVDVTPSVQAIESPQKRCLPMFVRHSSTLCSRMHRSQAMSTIKVVRNPIASTIPWQHLPWNWIKCLTDPKKGSNEA